MLFICLVTLNWRCTDVSRCSTTTNVCFFCLRSFIVKFDPTLDIPIHLLWALTTTTVEYIPSVCPVYYSDRYHFCLKLFLIYLLLGIHWGGKHSRFILCLARSVSYKSFPRKLHIITVLGQGYHDVFYFVNSTVLIAYLLCAKQMHFYKKQDIFSVQGDAGCCICIHVLTWVGFLSVICMFKIFIGRLLLSSIFIVSFVLQCLFKYNILRPHKTILTIYELRQRASFYGWEY